MSYDEMQISALIGLSGPTFFINNGSRGSAWRACRLWLIECSDCGRAAEPGSFEPEGIYTALVGAR